jgi:hypothetical protein
VRSGVDAVRTPAIPLRHSAAGRRTENDGAHRRKGPGSSPGPSISRASLGQALPAYAPTSIPSSTTANSGFVQVMFLPPQSNGGPPCQALGLTPCMPCANRPGIASCPNPFVWRQLRRATAPGSPPRGVVRGSFHPPLGDSTQRPC